MSGQGLEVVKGVMMDIIYVETKGIRVDGEALRLLQHGEFGCTMGAWRHVGAPCASLVQAMKVGPSP